MYTEAYRDRVRMDFVEYLRDKDAVEGALALGSGAVVYRDILSHIVVAVALRSPCDEEVLRGMMQTFCGRYGEFLLHTDERPAEGCAFSIFWPGGLSMRVQFAGTDNLLFGVPRTYRILLDKSGNFEERIVIRRPGGEQNHVQVPEEAYQFYYALRRCEMGIIRREYIMAERQLSDARMILLKLQLISVGEDPRFQRYNELDTAFLERLERTYPAARTLEAIRTSAGELSGLFDEVYTAVCGEAPKEQLHYLTDYDTEPVE